jgi:hypothetical protein
MSQVRFGSGFGLSALSAGVLVALLGLILGPAQATQAALVEGGNGPQLVIGVDDDNQANALIQAGAVANQSLNRGASIAFADLTVAAPAFTVVAPPEVAVLNPLVAAMIR